MGRWHGLLTNRAFLALWLGRTVSWLGNAMAPLALGFAVLDVAGTLGALSAVVAARSVPNLVLVLFGGVIADRSTRNRVMIWSAFISAGSQGLCAMMVATETATIPLLMALSVVNGAAAALSGPAGDALFRLVVPDNQLRDASALGRLGMNGALLGGTAAGGFTIGLFGPAMALGIDAATFLVAGLAYLFLPRLVGESTVGSSMVAGLRDGFRYVIASRWIAANVVVTWVYMICFAGGLQILALAVADRSFGRAGMGVIASCQIVGGIVGVLVITAMKDRIRLSPALAAMGCSLSVPLLVLAAGAAGLVAHDPPATIFLFLTAAAMFVAGAIGQGGATIQALALQRNVPRDTIGRVSSYVALASIGGIPVGEVLAAPLGHYLGIPAALTILAAGTTAVAAVAALLPTVRRINSGVLSATPEGSADAAS